MLEMPIVVIFYVKFVIFYFFQQFLIRVYCQYRTLQVADFG